MHLLAQSFQIFEDMEMELNCNFYPSSEDGHLTRSSFLFKSFVLL